MTVYTFEEMKDKYLGKKGTPNRDKYEAKLAKDLAKTNAKYTCPGDYIRESIKQKKIKLKDFAVMMNMSQSNLTELLQSKRRITPLVAQRLETNLDYPEDYWLKLQDDYDTEKKLQKKESVVLTADWAEKMLKSMDELKSQISVLISLQQQNHQMSAAR